MPVELRQATLRYGKPDDNSAAALDCIDLRIEDGEFVGIMGRTGCGKSTLVQLIAGLLVPTAGSVLLDGQDINDSGYDRRELRRTVGIVFQFPESQLFEQSVGKDVSFGPRQLGFEASETEERVRWALERVGFVPDDVIDKHPLGLSGGERRRVALAGVLASRPRVLILDEPVAGLDPDGRRMLMNLLAELNAKGVTVIMVSHNADCLADCAHRIVLLDAGRIVADGTPGHVFADAEKLQHLGVGVSQARLVAARLENLGLLQGEHAIAAYGDLVDALSARFSDGRCA